ncbi:MAG: discoidin domain-containing protein [Candidatus Aureabacteria bacterium]|nr:discoidin domain-containing protein [Candidatus Auribacterota bacterium]
MKISRKTIRTILIFAFALLFFCNINANAENNSRKILDDFNKINEWKMFQSEGVEFDLVPGKGFTGNCMRLDFDFTKRKGYVVVSKEVNIPLPEDYKFIFYIKGDSQDNNLEFKLMDDKGDTYWQKWENFKFTGEWKKIVLSKRNVAFGWGPGGGAGLEEIRKIEFAISCGEGGKGTVCIDELSFIGFKKAVSDIKMETKSSSFKNNKCKPKNAVDGNLETLWESKPSDPQWLDLDLGEVRKLTGVVLYWGKSYAKAYELLVSEDGKNWDSIYATVSSDGVVDDIYFNSTTARFLKILGRKRTLRYGYSLREVLVRTDAGGIFAEASSSKRSKKAQKALDGRINTNWHSRAKNRQWFKIDFREQKEIGGLFIHWHKDYAESYDISVSDDGKEWFTIYTTGKGNGGKDKIFFEETQTQFLKIELKESATKKGFGIKEIEVKAPAEDNALEKKYEIAAQESPPGYYPRWLTKEQAYWTIVGVSDDDKEALLCEDGTIEPHKKGFSIMPFLYLDGKLVTREDARVTQSLEKGYLPIPSVEWDYKNVIMDVKLFAYGKPEESIVYARYRIRNNREEEISGKLFLTIRPFQVYPPWQYIGGFSPIYNIRYKNHVIEINDKYKIFPLVKPEGFGVQPGLVHVDDLPEGDIVNIIQNGELPPKKDLLNNANWDSSDWDASAAIEYKVDLKPKAFMEFFVAIPLHDKEPDLKAKKRAGKVRAKFKRMLKETIAFWEAEVNRVEIDIPEVDIINTFKSNIAYNLITRDSFGFQPGSRNYDKSWIRDGGIVGSILLKLGFTDEMKKFIDWYTSYQYETGEIPPIVRPVEGPEPVDEYDSQGEFVFTILQYYLFSKDKEWLKGKLPNVIKALEYLVYLRNQRLTPEYKQVPAKKVFYGILPDSISHEGYVPPVHSYWDNFWALEGWKAGKEIAKILDRDDLSRWAEGEYQALKKSFYESLKLAMEQKKINYIPGCVEKGDHDATATAIAVIYCEELENLPQPQLKNTFDKYYLNLRRRMASSARCIFGPYELRTATAFIYMGQKSRALTLLRFLLKYRQPASWNQWAEVIDSDYRAPFYLGDMPHTWVGSEYLNAVRSLFVYELNNRLILAHGVDEKWLKEGVSVKDMPTYYGSISYRIEKEENILRAKFEGDVTSPPGGFVFKIPSAGKVKEVAVVEGVSDVFSEGEVVFYKLPAEINVYYKD